MKKVPRQYYAPLLLGCMGLILFVYGTWVVVRGNKPHEKMSLERFSQASGSAVLGSENTNTISIDVEGAVASPSVVKIASTARIQDALVAVGGLSATADRVWVEKHVNLAAKLTDGAKIYIPKLGEQVDTGSTAGDSGIVQDINQQININSATSDQLDSLPGVGPVTAQKIIAGRPYSTVQDLQTKKIVSNSVYLKIKDSIVAY